MTPNYVHPHEDLEYTIHGVNIAFTALGGMFLILRIYMRMKSLGRLGWDDWMIMLAWVEIPNAVCRCGILDVNCR